MSMDGSRPNTASETERDQSNSREYSNNLIYTNRNSVK